MAVQSKETSNAHTRAPTKTMSVMDVSILKIVKSQGVPEDPRKPKSENLVLTIDVMNGILERICVMSLITSPIIRL